MLQSGASTPYSQSLAGSSLNQRADMSANYRQAMSGAAGATPETATAAMVRMLDEHCQSLFGLHSRLDNLADRLFGGTANQGGAGKPGPMEVPNGQISAVNEKLEGIQRLANNLHSVAERLEKLA